MDIKEKIDDKHEHHEIGTVNMVSFKVGYDENDELCTTPHCSKLVKYCYTCNKHLD